MEAEFVRLSAAPVQLQYSIAVLGILVSTVERSID